MRPTDTVYGVATDAFAATPSPACWPRRDRAPEAPPSGAGPPPGPTPPEVGFRCRPRPLLIAGRSHSAGFALSGGGGRRRALAAARFSTTSTTCHSVPVHSSIALGAAGSTWASRRGPPLSGTARRRRAARPMAPPAPAARPGPGQGTQPLWSSLLLREAVVLRGIVGYFALLEPTEATGRPDTARRTQGAGANASGSGPLPRDCNPPGHTFRKSRRRGPRTTAWCSDADRPGSPYAAA